MNLDNNSKITCDIYPPLIGSVINLVEVPDAVFSEKMVGDGVAIEPFNKNIYSPINGTIRSIHKSKHAITITDDIGVDILVHIGLETVTLNGEGFKLKVQQGDKVKYGDLLGEFDLDYVSLNAKSLISPLLVLDNDKYEIEYCTQNISQLNVPILKIHSNVSNQQQTLDTNNLIKSAPIKIKNKNGIHARPAALISNKAREYSGKIIIEKNGIFADAKSIIALLGMALNYDDDMIFIYAENQKIINAISIIINDSEHIDLMQEDTNTVDDGLLESGKVLGNCYYGTVASSGLAVGKLIKNSGINYSIKEDSSDSASEQSKLLVAIEKVKQQIDEHLQRLNQSQTTIRDILSAHLVLLTDPHLLSQILTLIKQNKTAQFALNFVINQECGILAKTGNKLLVERQSDLRDIKNRIVSAMEGIESQKVSVTKPSILIAEELTPSDLLDLDKNIVGLVSVKGGTTSHVAILAKSYAIPLLIGVNPEILTIKVDSPVIINSKLAGLFIKPTVDEIKEIHQLQAEEQKIRNINKSLALNNAITIDNVQINCMGNITGEKDAKQLFENGAEGVGLFRTEFIYYDRDKTPSQEVQYQIYSNIASIFGDKPIIIRTLDAGGEKQISYLNHQHETNPVLGIRGIRLCLANIGLFEEQLSAILMLNRPNVKIMLPMVSTIAEYRQTRELINKLKIKLSINTNIELGVMVEAPSVALQSEIFAREVDFFSIGTNDLTQYILAIDREHPILASQIDHLHPAVLRGIDLVVKGANKYNKPVSVCGIMASEKIALAVLIGLGIKDLSMDINSIADNKAFIRKISKTKCVQVAQSCLNFATSGEVRSYLLEQFIEFI